MKRFFLFCSLSIFALLPELRAFAQDSSPLPTVPRATAVDPSEIGKLVPVQVGIVGPTP